MYVFLVCPIVASGACVVAWSPTLSDATRSGCIRQLERPFRAHEGRASSRLLDCHVGERIFAAILPTLSVVTWSGRMAARLSFPY